MMTPRIKQLSLMLLLVGLAAQGVAVANTKTAEEEESSRALQIAKRVALAKNTEELPSRGYQLSSLAVKRSKALQALRLRKASEPIAR